MTQHTKKAAKHHSSPKLVLDEAQKAQETLFKTGRKNAENLMHTADHFKHVAAECKNACSDHMGALAKSGNAASNLIQNFSTEIAKNHTRTVSDLAALSKEAFGCRTIDDMVGLYDKVLQCTWNPYLDVTNKLCSMWFDSYEDAREQLDERTATTSERIRKAMAA